MAEALGELSPSYFLIPLLSPSPPFSSLVYSFCRGADGVGQEIGLPEGVAEALGGQSLTPGALPAVPPKLVQGTGTSKGGYGCARPNWDHARVALHTCAPGHRPLLPPLKSKGGTGCSAKNLENFLCRPAAPPTHPPTCLPACLPPLLPLSPTCLPRPPCPLRSLRPLCPQALPSWPAAPGSPPWLTPGRPWPLWTAWRAASPWPGPSPAPRAGCRRRRCACGPLSFSFYSPFTVLQPPRARLLLCNACCPRCVLAALHMRCLCCCAWLVYVLCCMASFCRGPKGKEAGRRRPQLACLLACLLACVYSLFLSSTCPGLGGRAGPACLAALQHARAARADLLPFALCHHIVVAHQLSPGFALPPSRRRSRARSWDLSCASDPFDLTTLHHTSPLLITCHAAPPAAGRPHPGVWVPAGPRVRHLAPARPGPHSDTRAPARRGHPVLWQPGRVRCIYSCFG